MAREFAEALPTVAAGADRSPARRAWQDARQTFDTLWARLAHARRFAEVETFCLFVGYPRSGHSIVGALLNAHPDAVISHQLVASEHILRGCSRNALYARILARAAWFHRNGDRGHYPFAVPNQWQGRCRTLKVVGDKRGGAVSRAIADHPDFLDRTRRLAGVPVRLIHVVRNPFDNIAAIARWHGLSLAASTAFYFRHADVTLGLGRALGSDEMLTLRHEEMIRRPREVLSALCRFLGLQHDAGYLADCASVVFAHPTCSRRHAAWDAVTIREIERRMDRYPFLAGYAFELAPDEHGAATGAGN